MKQIEFTVEKEQVGRRLDHVLVVQADGVSRSEIQREIRAGGVLVGSRPVRRPSYRVREDDHIVWQIPSRPLLEPRKIPLSVLFEDHCFVIVDKRPGLVVHPGAGTTAPTLVEGLLADRSLPPSDDPVRPGIVHRLDKETSGVIVVAKTPAALSSLQQQFASRSVTKAYLAVVQGVVPEEEGWIDAPVGRDPQAPRRMSVQANGRPAQTGFHVLSRWNHSSLLVVRPRTGRTHQIRVHLHYIGYPVVGDLLYGGPSDSRLLLHAWRIAFLHPETGETVSFEAPVPDGFPLYPYEEIPWGARAART